MVVIQFWMKYNPRSARQPGRYFLIGAENRRTYLPSKCIKDQVEAGESRPASVRRAGHLHGNPLTLGGVAGVMSRPESGDGQFRAGVGVFISSRFVWPGGCPRSGGLHRSAVDRTGHGWVMDSIRLMSSGPSEPVGMGSCRLSEERWSAIRRTLNISPRELQIVQAMFLGHREEEIARDLSISRYTVHTHLGRMYRKLQVDGCPGLLLRVFRAHLSEEDAGDMQGEASASIHPARRPVSTASM